MSSAALHPVDPLILSQTRTTFSLLVLLPILVGTQGWQRIKLPARDLAYCFLLGTLGVAVSNYFYYVAIQRINVAVAIIVQYTAPVWVLLYVVARGQQKLTLQKVAAVGLALTGIALVIGLIGSGSLSAFRIDGYGLIAALLASFSFAFYNVGGHHILARYDRWRVLVWTLAAAAAFWLVVNPPWKIVRAHYEPAQWLFLFVFSMISVLGRSRSTFLACSISSPRAPSSPVASSRYFRYFSPRYCWEKSCARFKVWELSSCSLPSSSCSGRFVPRMQSPSWSNRWNKKAKQSDHAMNLALRYSRVFPRVSGNCVAINAASR